MKRTTVDIRELSDSKEVYGQRPNPIISVFIYSLIGLLLVAIIYSMLGKIEIVASATGIVRPNDAVSTVSSLIGGRVTGIYYREGQMVNQGDILLTVDTTELQITLDGLESSEKDSQNRIAMIDKFLAGINAGENPFSSDPSDDEYPYYIQYRDFEMALHDTMDNIEYDMAQTAENVETTAQKIAVLQEKLDGLNAYKSSVQEGKNLAADYPEYESMYTLYVSTQEKLTEDYLAQRQEIEADTSQETNSYYLSYYQAQVVDYEYLTESIKTGKSVFPASEDSTGYLLYLNYLSQLEEYERNYESAKETYNYYINGGGIGDAEVELLNYDKTMLEGYRYYQQSVESGQDMFDDDRESVFYRTLYITYQEEYAVLKSAADQAATAYESLVNNPDATPENVQDALEAVNAAQAACDAFKSSTLASIKNTILQIEASTAEKEISLGIPSLDHNIESAKAQMESAAAAITAYQNNMLAEYSKTLDTLKNQVEELRLAGESFQDKDALLTALESSYQNAKEQQFHQTITQINSSIQAAQTELISARSNYHLYQITQNLYQNNRDENGQPLSLSMTAIEQISTILSDQEAFKVQLDELETQIQQARKQIEQGTIVAEQDGVISELALLAEGDSISAGTALATIIPMDESEFKVQLYVNNADIANVQKGDMIQYNVAALPSNQYGVIAGKVTMVSTDVLLQDGEYSGYFLVEGSIANTALSDASGNSGAINIGMQVEAKIVTQTKSIFRYLLEKINLW